ncbi:hypothetical protein J8281_18685 [Aquimarina sp. U1-2]|uniref:hypothetical protein n=1 Tax=Aquimarina sp. U1-2 TaxID=2823141 RepID=UPI001AECC1E2|nr:hypothetical protein [Aquimarina sp. U1-2]MBP2834230.1 hypothetical protein [Aquimarina sp. U1-2]
MHNITFISTIHREIGKCNAEELYSIIDKLGPEVIFLEAIDETYSAYEKFLFSTYGVFHKKLEISAIQKYSFNTSFQYVPVCENGLSDAFHKKINLVCKNRELQKLIDNFNYLAAENGFEFLNSLECINLQEEMRVLESRIINNIEINKTVNADIEAYEKPMIRNIYLYCSKNHFSSAIFMCGAAHRKSIIEKIEKSKTEELVDLTWTIFEN